jgi:hypothetical protein
MVKTKLPTEVWLALGGVLMMVAVFLLNPVVVYRTPHSFLHASISYQILNGEVPPGDPLVAGYPVRYPWGVHLLAACLSRILKVTPFVSFAILNVAAMAAVILLIFRISRLMIRDRLANSLSVFIAVIAISPPYVWILNRLALDVAVETQGVPALKKFLNVNPMPVGLVFLLLFVYCLIVFLERKPRLMPVAGMTVGALGCGFFYAPFLPGILAGAGGVCLAAFIRRGPVFPEVRPARAAAALGVAVLCAVALFPYLRLIGGGVAETAEILNSRYIVINIIKYLIIVLPILVVVAVGGGVSGLGKAGPAGIVLWTFVAANAFCYFAFHLPLDNEHKFMLVSTLILGIIGGISFAGALRKYNRLAVLAVIIVFAVPGISLVYSKMSEREQFPYVPAPGGINLDPIEPKQQDLYAWIRENTATGGVFIDTEIDLPVCGRRKLFVPARRPRGERANLYGRLEFILGLQSGYGLSFLNQRRRILEDIYAGKASGIARMSADLGGSVLDFYMVARSTRDVRTFGEMGLEQIFCAPDGVPALYRLP